VAGESPNFFEPHRCYKMPRDPTRSPGALNTRGGKIAIFLPQSQFISETVRDNPTVTLDH